MKEVNTANFPPHPIVIVSCTDSYHNIDS